MGKPLLFHFILLFISIFCLSVYAHAQTDSSAVYMLDKAEVSRKIRIGVNNNEHYTTGGTTYQADSMSLVYIKHGSLTDFISQFTPVFIRETGNGMKASVSLRGTASSHTAVNWNGLTLNSLTSGQSDFSQLPVFFFDDIHVYPGGEGALYGNGAIGGSILLKSEPQQQKGLHVDLQQSFSSYQHSFTGGKITYGSGRWTSKTALLYDYNKNNFGFKNIHKADFPDEKQQNASYHKFGVLQEVFYRAGDWSTLSAKVWFMDFYREIQPMMSANTSVHEYDTITDKSFISLVSFNHKHKQTQLSTSAAYVYDKQLYRDDIIATNRFTLRGEAEKYLFAPFRVKIGGYAEYIKPDVYSYENDVTEWRGDIYVLLNYKINTKLEASINLRQSFVSELSPPFTPAAGLAYRLIDHDKNKLKLRTSISKSFRAPSLNDRYWGNSGVTNLESETGKNIEAGFDYSLDVLPVTIQAQTTFYYNKVENWIQWVPRGALWKPSNFKDVEIKGAEIGIKATFVVSEINVDIEGNYAYVDSRTNSEAYTNDPNKGKQLALLPYNRWNASANFSYKNVFAQLGMHYTGKSSSSDRSNDWKTAGFALANVSGGYNFNINRQHKFILMAQINNLFNKEYESVKFFAMPKRNWSLSIRYFL